MQHDIHVRSLSHANHCSTDHITQRSSLLRSLLPSILSTRLPSSRSIKDLASTYIRPSIHRRSSSDISAPPPYTEDPPSSDDEDMDVDYTSAPNSRPSSSGSATPLLRHPFDLVQPLDSIQNADNLIRFKFANHGLLLVAQSAHESRSTGTYANDEYQRRLYLDGLTYLLRGLPNELSEEERAKLNAALPEDVGHAHKEDVSELPTSKREGSGRMSDLPYLRLLVQTVVFWMFLAFATALPHIKRLVRHAHAFERRHKVGEQFLAQTLLLAQLTYRQVVAFICTVWAMNDGIVGRTLTAVGVWCAHNVSEGIRDGLAEASATLREERAQ